MYFSEFFVTVITGGPTTGIEYTFVNSKSTATVIEAVDRHQYVLFRAVSAKNKKGIQIWRCRKRKGGCKVFVKMHEKCIIQQVHEHNHVIP